MIIPKRKALYNSITRVVSVFAMGTALVLASTQLVVANPATVAASKNAQVTIDKGDRLANKVALVTGAASGNGEAIAKLFAAQGASVVVVDINGAGAEKVTQAITNAGGKAIAVTADVTKEADVQRMIDTATSQYGRLDILVNNAGVFDMLLPVGEVSDDVWNRVIDINLNAPMRAIRKAIPVFEKQGGGVIINTASVAGFTGARGGGAAYVASKHGVIGLTKNVAYTYQHKNIRTNAIAPGRVLTNLRDNSQKILGAKDAYDKTINDWKDIEEVVTKGHNTIPRAGEPSAIAAVALFLASDESVFVNGAVITADGGWTSY